MNKYLLYVFLAFVVPCFAAEKSSGDEVTSLIKGLDAILSGELLIHEENEAIKQFFEDLEQLGENANLDSLIQRSQGGNYFNTAFGQIPEHPQSRLSERLFKMALDKDDSFEIQIWGGNPKVSVAHDYLTKRFGLDLDEETKSGLYGGFVDSEFLAGLRQHFEAVAAAGSESEKSEAERMAKKFLENYAYRPIREVLEEKAEKQNSKKKEPTPDDENEFLTVDPRIKKPNALPIPTVRNKENGRRDPSQFPQLFWGLFIILIVASSIFILRKKPGNSTKKLFLPHE